MADVYEQGMLALLLTFTSAFTVTCTVARIPCAQLLPSLLMAQQSITLHRVRQICR